jgi:hypothetical protein
MIQAQQRIADLGADVLLVAYHDPELMMSRMLRDLAVPFLLLVDRQRHAYERWGLGKYTAKALLVPGLYPAIVKLLLRRPPNLGTVPDTRQLGGDFVVDGAGRLALVKRMRSIYDRAPVPDLLSAIERAKA